MMGEYSVAHKRLRVVKVATGRFQPLTSHRS
jgi:hypothetical protein